MRIYSRWFWWRGSPAAGKTSNTGGSSPGVPTRRRDRLQGWTLSEMLVMMIVAGIVFVVVMDGVALFNRYAGMKTKQITENMSLWEGYYHLRDLAAAADSVSAQNGIVRLLRKGTTLAELFGTDSMLVLQYGLRTDTLIPGISGLRLAGVWEHTGTDTILLTFRDGNMLTLSFPVAPSAGKLLVKNLREREKSYDYE